MPTIANSHIPAPKGWDEFEDISLSAAKIRWKCPDFFRHGRQGQRQDGVDIYGKDEKGRSIGIQCKNTVEGISIDVINSEARKAESFSPPIDRLFIATTAKRDASLQRFARELTAEREAENKFGVDILFWDDICHDLTSDEEHLYQHYPQLRPKNHPLEATHDQKLFDEFQATFPFIPTIQLLRQHDFGADFSRTTIQPLFDFINTWDSVEKEFINQDLEEKRRELYSQASILGNEICEKTVPVGNGSYLSVFSDSLRGKPRPDWVRKEARELNAAANVFVRFYEDFIRYCREKLCK